MPLLITGKVFQDSLPLSQTVDIKEISVIPGATAIADVWANDDGTFSLMALSDTSIIEVSSYGYATQHFPAKSVPAVINLVPDPAFAITGTTKKKKDDNTLIWVCAGIGLLALAALASGSDKTKKTAPGIKGLSLPARKPKTIIEF